MYANLCYNEVSVIVCSFLPALIAAMAVYACMHAMATLAANPASHGLSIASAMKEEGEKERKKEREAFLSRVI